MSAYSLSKQFIICCSNKQSRSIYKLGLCNLVNLFYRLILYKDILNISWIRPTYTTRYRTSNVDSLKLEVRSRKLAVRSQE